MWSPSRRIVLALPLALLACGFTPAFGPSGPAEKLLGTIEVQAPSDRFGFDLVRRLEERLGRAKVVKYDLTYQMKTEQVSLGITADGAITRYNLLGIIDWQLSDRATKTKIASGREQNFTAWSATGVTIAAVNAETDAGARLMRLMADQIVTRLIAVSASLPQAAP